MIFQTIICFTEELQTTTPSIEATKLLLGNNTNLHTNEPKSKNAQIPVLLKTVVPAVLLVIPIVVVLAAIWFIRRRDKDRRIEHKSLV